LLKVHLKLVATLEQAIADIDATVGKALASVHESARLLRTMPGISDVTAHVIVAEIGVDMTRFASDAHLRSSARQCTPPYRLLRLVDPNWKMLHEFLATNRTLLIDRCRVMVGSRSDPKATEEELAHGIPIFLDQLIGTLTLEEASHPQDSPLTAHNARGEVASGVGTTAALHGRDLFLEGFTIDQVVRDYGDVCQAVTKLAIETGVLISVDEFRTFNRCLDNAIAGAVTEYAKHTSASAEGSYQSLNSQRKSIAQELLTHLDAATLAVTAIKTGTPGIGGPTAGALHQSHAAMRNVIERWIAEG
jgi:hypothetical protein